MGRMLTTRRICEPCNGWMNDQFEGPAQSIVTAMIQGTRQDLDAPSQDIVAGRVAKTVLMRKLPAPGAAPDTPQYRWFRQNARPLPHTHVWLGAHSHRNSRTRRMERLTPGELKANGPLRRLPGGDVNIFGFGRLLVHVRSF